ncbi:MAG: carbonic anhydrase [Actinobacteria bacterium]|nr:carbonic anhydrase [Actinomycetota bacterium]
MTDSTAVSASDALARLIEGNARFAHGMPSDPVVTAERRAALSECQHPFATVLGCVDSRVPVELVFDQSVGDLLTVRSAGQALAGSTAGNVEFGVRALGTELVAVLAHTSCGAVAAARDTDRPDGPLGDLVAEIARRLDHHDADDYPTAVRRNLAASVAELRGFGTMTLPDGRRPIVVGLLYDLSSGRVEVVDDAGLTQA